MAYTQEQLKELYKTLPRKVQDAIFSEETSNTLHEIGQKRKLHIDQVGQIADVVGEVLLGIAPREGIAAMIAKRANVPKEVATEVAHEVAAKIFAPIQEHLRGSTNSEEDVVTLPSYEEEKLGAKSSKEPTLVPKAAAAPTVSASPTPAPSHPPSPTLSPKGPAADATPATAPPTASAGERPATAAHSMIGAKLGGVTYGGTEQKEEKQPEQPPEIANDPYREPIE